VIPPLLHTHFIDMVLERGQAGKVLELTGKIMLRSTTGEPTANKLDILKVSHFLSKFRPPRAANKYGRQSVSCGVMCWEDIMAACLLALRAQHSAVSSYCSHFCNCGASHSNFHLHAVHCERQPHNFERAAVFRHPPSGFRIQICNSDCHNGC
jgi:hypothetical protein